MQKFLISLKILFILITNKLIASNVFAFDAYDIDPENDGAESIINLSWSTWFSLLDKIFAWIVNHIFWVLAVILIGVFIYVWYLFITSSWDEAQFKKAWKTFVYAIIWIIIIILSFSVIKLISKVWI